MSKLIGKKVSREHMSTERLKIKSKVCTWRIAQLGSLSSRDRRKIDTLEYNPHNVTHLECAPHFKAEGGEYGLAGAELGVKVRVVDALTSKRMKTISIKCHGAQAVGDYQINPKWSKGIMRIQQNFGWRFTMSMRRGARFDRLQDTAVVFILDPCQGLAERLIGVLYALRMLLKLKRRNTEGRNDDDSEKSAAMSSGIAIEPHWPWS
ncbi:hypothetical protein K438DRAFT_1753644 [Mycena galopus ATCC 62051]|nr:hypothetical protein K438DRAFT_1753644 [Mycena galopus ATCC 62051]